jgi:hypothetical protein
MLKRCQPEYRLGALRAVCGLLVLLFSLGTGRAAAAALFVDYLYVEANEGDSSGGHVALRLGDEVFHFQHETPGILRVRRIEAAGFNHSYAMLGNRTIRESRIAVSEDTHALLRDAFNRLFLIQDAQLEYREALLRDLSLFEQLQKMDPSRRGEDAIISLKLKGLGYFLPDADGADRKESAVKAEAQPGRASSQALQSLRQRIRATHGKQFLANRLARTRAALRDLEVRAAETSPAAISRNRYPEFAPSFSTRYQDCLLILYALKILQDAPALRPGTFRSSDAPSFRLEARDAVALQAFARRLEGDLAGLVDSPRTDWGLPLVVGMARLAAIEASLASGRLVLLDISRGEEQATVPVEDGLRKYFPAMAKEKQALFLRRRAEFFVDGRMREADYASIERTGNLFLDLERAIVSGGSPGDDSTTLFPSREARLNVPVPDGIDPERLTRELARARRAEREYTAALDRLYSYDLVRRNCVTEIFAVINRAIADNASKAAQSGNSPSPAPVDLLRKESQRRLGGYLDASHGLAFIPFVSAGEVADSYAVLAHREQPSYRAARLAQMKRSESRLKVLLRESNTITSKAYRPDPKDSKFLFFTDGSVLLRPLFGAFNLLVGLGESLSGIALLPVKGPDRLISGTKGVLFSLPELFFVNLRKGSTAFVEQSAEDDLLQSQWSWRPEQAERSKGE